MRKVGTTSSGNVLVEMAPEEWERLTHYKEIPGDLASAVKQYRKGHGLSQTALAEKCGVTRNWISMIERGLTADNTILEKYRRLMSIISL